MVYAIKDIKMKHYTFFVKSIIIIRFLQVSLKLSLVMFLT